MMPYVRPSGISNHIGDNIAVLGIVWKVSERSFRMSLSWVSEMIGSRVIFASLWFITLNFDLT